MADLPQIQSLTPVTIPAVSTPEKTYPDLFLSTLRVITDQESMQTWAMAKLNPYNYTTKELMPNDVGCKEFRIEDVYAEAARVPLLATVMGGLLTVIDLLVKEKELEAAISAGATDLEDQLAAVKNGLGIQSAEEQPIG